MIRFKDHKHRIYLFIFFCFILRYIWGTGFFGYYDEPKAVNNSENVTWRNVSLGNNVICLTDDQGRAYSWG